MSNNIWHTDINKLTDDGIVFIARGDELGYGMYDPETNCIKNFITYEFYELDEIDSYCYLHDLLMLESKLKKAIQALKLAKEKFEFIKYHIESGEDITVDSHCQIGIDEINKFLNKKD